VLFAIGNGYQRGVALSLSQYVGLVVGVVVGAAIAPFVADLLGIRGPLTRPLTGVVVLFAAGSIGSSAGYWLGEPLRLKTLRRPGGARFDGLGGAVFTRDVARAKRIASRVDTGMVFINHPTWTTPDLPFGGIQSSGYGRELSSMGIQEFVNKKLVRVASIDAPA